MMEPIDEDGIDIDINIGKKPNKEDRPHKPNGSKPICDDDECELKQKDKIAEAYQSTWRPAVGWVGLITVIYAGVVYNLMLWIWTLFEIFGHIPAGHEPPNNIEADILIAIIGATLGIAGMRSYDKVKGTNSRKFW